MTRLSPTLIAPLTCVLLLVHLCACDTDSGNDTQDMGSQVDGGDVMPVDMGTPDSGSTGMIDMGGGGGSCDGVVCDDLFSQCVDGTCEPYPFCFVDATCTGGTFCRNQFCVPGDIDFDQDGFNADVDCDEMDVTVNPDGTEVCNRKDDNCSGTVDDGDIVAMCGPVQDIACLTDSGECGCRGVREIRNEVCDCPQDRADLTGPPDDCECTTTPSPNVNGVCGSAISLGEVTDAGESTQVSGTVAIPGQLAWYSFVARDLGGVSDACDNFYVDVRFEENPGDAFEFKVHRGSCDDDYCTEYGTNYTVAMDLRDGRAGQCPCTTGTNVSDTVNLCQNDTTEFFVEVRRRPGVETPCDTAFVLDISNGVYSTD